MLGGPTNSAIIFIIIIITIIISSSSVITIMIWNISIPHGLPRAGGICKRLCDALMSSSTNGFSVPGEKTLVQGTGEIHIMRTLMFYKDL